MKITAEDWARYQASNSRKRKRSSSLRAIHRHVVRVRQDRIDRKPKRSLDVNQRLQLAKFNREREAKLEAERKDKEYNNEVRKTLLCAARIARAMGFDVKKSTDCNNHVSSYYATRDPFGKPVRISDHDLPVTRQRDIMSHMHGGGSPFAGQIIIMEPMSKTRLRRLIVLAEAGRL